MNKTTKQLLQYGLHCPLWKLERGKSHLKADVAISRIVVVIYYILFVNSLEIDI